MSEKALLQKEENMNIKKILKTVEYETKSFLAGIRKGHSIWFSLMPFGLIFIMFFVFDDIGDCASSGKVWDYDKDYCRDDCLLWNKNIGCVELSQEMLNQLSKCGEDNECYGRTLDDFTEGLCKKYKLPYDKERNQCFWDFKPELCHKLPGNWLYPKICDK